MQSVHTRNLQRTAALHGCHLLLCPKRNISVIIMGLRPCTPSSGTPKHCEGVPRSASSGRVWLRSPALSPRLTTNLIWSFQDQRFSWPGSTGQNTKHKSQTVSRRSAKNPQGNHSIPPTQVHRPPGTGAGVCRPARRSFVSAVPAGRFSAPPSSYHFGARRWDGKRSM